MHQELYAIHIYAKEVIPIIADLPNYLSPFEG